MTDNNKPKQDSWGKRIEQEFLQLLNAKPSNSKVGQAFITSTSILPQKTEQPNQNVSTPRKEPPYLKALNAKRDDSKVGQTFITSTKMQLPKAVPSEQKLSPLMEKTILDIMKAYGVDRQKAINILNQPM